MYICTLGYNEFDFF
jgi:hypothetical protein